jgi:formylglycine-generating enzyme required for sulfatase activity
MTPEEVSSNLDSTMVFVQGGTFTMGCTPEQGNDCKDNEKPAHSVTVNDFYLCKYETTQRLWKAVMGSNPMAYNGDINLPVGAVNRNDIQEFIQKLNAMTGKIYRLPTEAEWEYAARGGNRSKGYKYSGSNNIDEVAWSRENSGEKPHPVGTKQPNELGIYDMSGNVSEWVDDLYRDYSSGAQIKVSISTTPVSVDRDCSFVYYDYDCRVSRRGYSHWYDRSLSIGFRLARDP